MTRLPFPDGAFGAFLFDMDGTLLSSIAAAERVWSAWARKHRLDVAAFLPTIHGVRARETIRALNLPGIDLQAEVDALTQAELDDIEGIEFDRRGRGLPCVAAHRSLGHRDVRSPQTGCAAPRGSRIAIAPVDGLR